jgi:hypothetical protein
VQIHPGVADIRGSWLSRKSKREKLKYGTALDAVKAIASDRDGAGLALSGLEADAETNGRPCMTSQTFRSASSFELEIIFDVAR